MRIKKVRNYYLDPHKEQNRLYVYRATQTLERRQNSRGRKYNVVAEGYGSTPQKAKSDLRRKRTRVYTDRVRTRKERMEQRVFLEGYRRRVAIEDAITEKALRQLFEWGKRRGA